MPDLLIRNAEVNGRPGQSVYIQQGRITAIGPNLEAHPGADCVEAEGGALLPGLKDHHIHLAATAVAEESLQCGPPQCNDAAGLSQALKARVAQTPGGWIRGIGYSETVAGDIDAAWLDRVVSDVPVRLQHRGGRLWVLNRCALQVLQVGEGDPVECIDGKPTGRVYDQDDWLRHRMLDLGLTQRPNLATISRRLASYGITGVTDTTAHNGLEELGWFFSVCASGECRQRLRMMGNASLDAVVSQVDAVEVGEHKFHLLESALPSLEEVVEAIRCSHGVGRNVAFHCVTRAELVFALSALQEAGVRAGDRIEHASVTPPEALSMIVKLGVTVVTQPALVYARGDHYLAQVAGEDQPWLYRLRGFLDAGVPLAGSSDAPYTDPNPWLAIAAAVKRRTRDGQVLGADEALNAKQALSLYTGELATPGVARRGLSVGDVADLCLLPVNWVEAAGHLSQMSACLTLSQGRVIWSQAE